MDFKQQTLVLIKPDGVKRGLIGEIMARFEKVGLKIVGMKMIKVSREHAGKHYPVSRKDWIKSIGERALDTYKEYGRDPGEDLENLNPMDVGKKMATYLIDFLTEDPIVAMILEGENAITTVRKMTGHTFGDKAVPGTIRGDYTNERGYMGFVYKRAGRNLIHASGNPEEAEFEIKLWFKKAEIYLYKRVEESL